jgi:Cu(I)/Ag(I) efflux system membrane fusion protein
VAGRLEKVFVRYAFQHVRKGEKIADIYSPELAAAQREWLYVQRTDPGNESILRASRQRLLNMGMTDSQIDQVTARKEAGYSVPLYSAAEGIVVQRGGQAPAAPVAPPSSTSADMGGPASMNAPTASQTAQANDNTTGEDLLREGAYVAAGQPLFEVVRISSLLLEVNLPATAIAYVRKGDKLKASTRNKTVTASVDLIQPFAQAGEPFVKVRSYLPDTAGLTVGELVTATFEMPAVEGLWLPASAVYDLGTRKVAFVKHGQHFTAVEVETGVAADQQIMVISGVASADEVASDAQFLIDNEGFIKTL